MLKMHSRRLGECAALIFQAFCGLIGYVKQLSQKGASGAAVSARLPAGSDEEWQLSKDSADAATAGVRCCAQHSGSIGRKQKAEFKTVTEVLSTRR